MYMKILIVTQSSIEDAFEYTFFNCLKLILFHFDELVQNLERRKKEKYFYLKTVVKKVLGFNLKFNILSWYVIC